MCDVDILVEDALDATCCIENVQYPYTEYDAFNIDQLEPSSYLYDASYDSTDCVVSFNWAAYDEGCPGQPPCFDKVEFYVWKDNWTPTLAYTDTTGVSYGTFEYDLANLQALNDTLCLEGWWYGYSKAYDCCCNVEENTTADDSVFVSVEATHFKIKARDHVTLSDTLYEGKLFDVEIIPVNDCGLRDCEFEGCIEGCTNYNSNIVNLTLFSNPTMIYDGYLLTENNVAHMTMNDLVIKAWLCPCCGMYSYSDPITVIYPPIEPPTNTSAYDIPNDQGGWISVDYELSLNDPFNTTHYPHVNPAYMPFIDHYVVARNSLPDGSGTWHAIAFVDLYDPVVGNLGHVDIQVPAGDTLYPYQMAAVCTDAKLFSEDLEINLKSKKALKETTKKNNSPEVVYVTDGLKLGKSSQSPWSGCGNAAGRDNIPGYADMTVFLEGPYQAGGTMNNGTLVIPTISPYDSEDIGTLPTVTGRTLIDWIYVQLRSTSDGETVQEANAFVLDNGKVVDTQGNYSLPFFYTSGKQYFVVVQHRNHLSMMSLQRKCFGDSPTESSTIDLTLAGSVWDNGFKQVETGVYAMYAGDANHNGEVQTSDKNDYWNIQVGQAGYKESDFNLNGQVQTSDVNDKWQYNVGASTKVPVQLPPPPKNSNNNASRNTQDANNKSVGLTFYFENGFLAPDHSYYEFDVMIGATESDTRLGDTQVYLDYSTDGFGESIVDNSKITVTKGVLLQGDFSGLDLYSLLNMEDNTASRVSITYQYNLAALLPSVGNIVPKLPDTDQLMHVRIDIANMYATAGLSFDIPLMTGQQYQSDNLTANKYDPINAGNSDDHTLPVELSSFTAVFNAADDNIKLEWNTATETNVLGFNIYCSEIDDLSRAGRHINYSLLDAAGTTSEPQSYDYIDVVSDVYATHYYWLEVVDLGGTSSLHGPIAYTPGDLDGDMTPDLIDETKLIGCWPNPAKDNAQIKYQIKGSVIAQDATISVYNIRGELVTKAQGSNGVARLDTSEFAHGIYFYRLQTDDFSEIKKMIVVK